MALFRFFDRRSRIADLPLRCILLLLLVVPPAAAVALVGYLCHRNGQIAIEDLSDQLVVETHERVIREIVDYLQVPPLINQLNRDAVAHQQLDLQDMSELETHLFARLQQFEQVSAILFADPQGRFRFVERLPALYLGAADPPHPDRIYGYRLDRNGQRGAQVYLRSGVDVRRDRIWYRRAVATEQPGWSPVFQYGTLNSLSLNAFQPVYDRQTKQLLGVFSVSVQLGYLSELLHRLDISRSGQVLIIDQAGSLIATSTQEFPYRTLVIPEQGQEIQPLRLAQSKHDLTRAIGEHWRQWQARQSPAAAPAQSQQSQQFQQSQSFQWQYSGDRYYVKITPFQEQFQDQYALDWQIVTVVPESHFLQMVHANTQQTVFLSLVVLIIALLLGFLAANHLTARLAQLDRISRELASGHLDQRLATDSPIYEFNNLAQTFNQMADQLQRSFDGIKVALAESEEKFSTLFHCSPESMALVMLTEGRCVEANDNFLNLLDYSREQLIGRPLVELDIWNDLEQPAYLQQVLQQQGYIRNLEMSLTSRTGQRKTLLISIELIEMKGETYALGMGRDISDRKRAEVSLRQALQYIEMHFEHSPLAIVEWNRDGTILRWSNQAEQLLGWSAAEVISRTWQDIPLVYTEDYERVIAELAPLLNGSVTNRIIKNRNYGKDGRIVLCQWYSSAVFDELGRLASVLSFGEDVTHRFELARMKDEFISVVSHELRTPLTSIRGALGILQTGVFDHQPDRSQQMLRIAINNSDRLVRLVDDILCLERLKSGKVELVREPIQVQELLEQAVNSVQALADQAEIRLVVDGLKQEIRVAPDAMIQTLTNLLSNAIKFSPSGSTVWLNATVVQAPADDQDDVLDWVQFTVRDEGRGIPAEKLELIFEEFQQVDVSDSRKKGGTGLGLAICKRIVQQHGGRIWAENRLDRGSTFYLRLPLT